MTVAPGTSPWVRMVRAQWGVFSRAVAMAVAFASEAARKAQVGPDPETIAPPAEPP